MARSAALIAAVLVTGCSSGTPAVKDSALVEPAEFAAWPSVTEKPVSVSAHLWLWCRPQTPEDAAAEVKVHGPHAQRSIDVKVSPEAIGPFRAGEPLPVGAVVVKLKYPELDASGPFGEYAVMVKRETGYDPEKGDWEYAYVTLKPERKVVQGRLAECSGCHASAKNREYLFRTYGNEVK